MEVKKSKKADLEGQKSTSMLIGYIFALGAIFAAFEWTTREYKETEPVVFAAYAPMEEEVPPVTQPIFQMAPPPPMEVPQVPEILDIVEDTEEIEENEAPDSEDTNEAITGPSAPVSGPVMGPAVQAEVTDEEEIFQVVEEMPEFPGGMEKLLEYLSRNIKYPTIAQEQGIQGRVFVQFVVNKDGSIVDVEVVRSPDASLSKEAERVVKLMPRWKPARQGNKPVRSRFRLPVMFKLQ